jgi:sugar/nucleoside kinase (ribokinase family)
MEALFVGQTYIDVTILSDVLPVGDDKAVAHDYAVSFGGNAVTAAFACARLGFPPDLIASLADDWLGRMFLDMAAKYQVPVHGRKVRRSSLSFILPKAGQRSILRARDDDYLHPFPILNLGGCRALHLDGHQADAALHYARVCREAGALTSLDGGGLRENTHDLLAFVDIAIVAERLCQQMRLSEIDMLAYLRSRGCRVGGVTQGERGLLWYEGDGEIELLPALDVPANKVIDTSGAGDVFHGAYVASHLARPAASWRDHFVFARAAAAFKVQRLGNEAGLPTETDVALTMNEWPEAQTSKPSADANRVS